MPRSDISKRQAGQFRPVGRSGRRVNLLGYGACALAGALWSTAFYWGRLALNEMSVEHMVLYRFLFASLGMRRWRWVIPPVSA